MLLQLSQIFSLYPLHPAPSLPQAVPTPLFIVHVHGSCIKVLWLIHFLCCTLHPRGYSVTTYLYFLIPSRLHSSSHIPLPYGNHQNALHTYDSVSVLLVCLVCFLDTFVDILVFITILLFIVLIIFFILNKFLK